MILYIYSKCSTCQEALRFLKKNNIPHTVKEIVSTPPSTQELEKMLSYYEGNSKKILNTSGMLYREMGLSQKLEKMQLSEVLQLLCQNGMLIKRPFLLGDGFGLTGFNEKLWSEKLKTN